MDIFEAMKQRRSVRTYTDRPIEGEVLSSLKAEIDACNMEGGLHIQLVLDEPEAFGTGIFKYGQFKGVRNYLCFVGPNNDSLDEKIGYYGERIILRAQQLGLSSCWVALTFNKRRTRYELAPGEKLALVASIGYGTAPSKPRKSKSIADVSNAPANAPDWFMQGVAAALLAPTAVNQQKFRFEYMPPADDGKPRVRATTKRGTQTHVDLGIAKYHFELAAGKENFDWAE
ncbi:MAG: nitroreductase [Atopobiaceae bacterium]|nr:nitroreductase [Atopobiaceae bacterium]